MDTLERQYAMVKVKKIQKINNVAFIITSGTMDLFTTAQKVHGFSHFQSLQNMKWLNRLQPNIIYLLIA